MIILYLSTFIMGAHTIHLICMPTLYTTMKHKNINKENNNWVRVKIKTIILITFAHHVTVR